MFIEKEQRPPGELPFSEVMNKAADLIEKRGHVQRAFKDSCGRLCLFAALHEAQTGKVYNCPQGDSIKRTAAHERLARWLNGPSICEYNNSHSQSEVLALLRQAATEA